MREYKQVSIDFETRSTVDLRKTGAHIYAEDPSTEVLCMAYAFDDEPVKCWHMGEIFPQEVLEHIKSGKEVCSFNAIFEFLIFNSVISPAVSQNTKMKLEQMTCRMAQSYAMGLPGSLEKCSAALGIEQGKDMEGARLMLQMSKPKEILPDGKVVWWDSPEKMDRLVAYCINDVVVEREVGKRMFKLSPYEKRVWVLDQVINSRGITVDKKAVANAVLLVEKEKERLDKEMRKLTNNAVATCNAVQQLKDYLEFFGVSSDSLDKPSVVGLLTDPSVNSHAKEILSLRSQGGKAATAKLNPMLNGIGDDNRLRGCFQYSGANTRRWSGRRVQLHNLKRPSLKHKVIEEIVEDISNGMTAEMIDMIHGNPLGILADCTRAFLMAAPENELVTCDFSSIEARVLAWLAGQDNVLDIFREDKDIYLVQASNIFRQQITDKNDPRRQIGKVAILALGYQGGVGAFQTMAKGYGVKMEPAFKELWEVIDDNTREFAESRYKQAGSKHEISREEFLASEVTKIMWREANPKIVKYWADAEAAFIQAVLNPGTSFAIGNNHRSVRFKKSGSFMWCQLPSCGVICYPYPEIKETKTPWDTTKKLPTYMSEDGQSKKWQRFSTYGGSIVENITQAVARDLLADAMLRLEDNDFKIVLHVHDEIVCEMPDSKVDTLGVMEKIMSTNPKWAFDLPTAAAGWHGKRYRK